jgi:hypothetical protein
VTDTAAEKETAVGKGEDEPGQRQLLFAALSDIGGSVSANDQKAAAALVVHALLFAGVTSLVGNFGPIYKESGSAPRYLGVALILFALALFIGSLLALLLAVSPYRPLYVHQDVAGEYKGVFFPSLDDLGHGAKTWTWGWFWPRLKTTLRPVGARRPLPWPADQRSLLLAGMRENVHGLTTRDVDNELMVEVLKLKDILDWESCCARWGYRLLAAELIVLTAFFVLIAVIAAHHVH